jgi:hypothetical protein
MVHAPSSARQRPVILIHATLALESAAFDIHSELVEVCCKISNTFHLYKVRMPRALPCLKLKYFTTSGASTTTSSTTKANNQSKPSIRTFKKLPCHISQ